MSIWHQLPKPIFCLAPMEDVTDTVFRQLLCELGKPPLMFSEFMNIHSIYSHAQDVRRLEYTDQEKPLILQVWGLEPELYCLAGQLAVDLGFDGIDINMGCPIKKIISKGACSALIKTPELAGDIIQATIDGTAGKIPVSVKTRIGFDSVVTEEWTKHLLSFDIAALTVHGRTSKQMSKVPCDWDEIGKVVNVRDRLGVETLIIGNGDILSLSQAQQMVDRYKVDGVMIGRGIFQNPWLFATDDSPRSINQKLDTLKRHLAIWSQVWQGQAYYNKLKRFFKIYVSDFDGASELRSELMQTESVEECQQVIDNFLATSN